jgi:hypothetical protein
MKSAFSAALLFTAAIMTLPACSKRDREEVKKTKDGSETFVYVKPDLKKYAKKSSAPSPSSTVESTDAASKPDTRSDSRSSSGEPKE